MSLQTFLQVRKSTGVLFSALGMFPCRNASIFASAAIPEDGPSHEVYRSGQRLLSPVIAGKQNAIESFCAYTLSGTESLTKVTDRNIQWIATWFCFSAVFLLLAWWFIKFRHCLRRWITRNRSQPGTASLERKNKSHLYKI